MTNNLSEKLNTLTVFRKLLDDGVLKLLVSYLNEPSPEAYCAFVYALYEKNGGNITDYIRELCENSDNAYVRTVGMKKEPPAFMREALAEDLKILGGVSGLTPDKLRECLDYKDFLPAYDAPGLDLSAHYLHRTENIGRYGYGIYAKNAMFYVNDRGSIMPVSNPDKISLSDLIDYERERGIIIENTKAFLDGKPAANILLTGDAGTGKSSTVKAVENEFFADGLRLVEIRKSRLGVIPKLLGDLSLNPLKFVLFIDDLSFLKDDDSFNDMKAVLEGSVSAKSKNVIIYATSNRRHIIKETFSAREGDEIHLNDTMQELISLSERFGIHVSFSKPDKKTYLHIVRSLAEKNGIKTDPKELEAKAERFALERGGRSARLAGQFVDSLISKSN